MKRFFMKDPLHYSQKQSKLIARFSSTVETTERYWLKSKRSIDT